VTPPPSPRILLPYTDIKARSAYNVYETGHAGGSRRIEDPLVMSTARSSSTHTTPAPTSWLPFFYPSFAVPLAGTVMRRYASREETTYLLMFRGAIANRGAHEGRATSTIPHLGTSCLTPGLR